LFLKAKDTVKIIAQLELISAKKLNPAKN